jgi:undecaprenyl-diphosphatase
MGRRGFAAVASLGAGVVAVALLYPGGLGQAGPVRVTGGFSVSVYRAVSGAAAGAPSWAGWLLDLSTDGLLLVLGLLLSWMGVAVELAGNRAHMEVSARRGRPPRAWRRDHSSSFRAASDRKPI